MSSACGRRRGGAWRTTDSNSSRVAIPDLDQTDLEFFNPSNRFDAEGLTVLIEDIEDRRKLRNDIEQDATIQIRTRNLEAEKQALEIERESEEARLEQERDVEFRRAVQQRRAGARARRTRDAGRTRPDRRSRNDRAGAHRQRAGHSEARIASEREIRRREIERPRTVEEAEITAREQVENARILRSAP